FLPLAQRRWRSNGDGRGVSFAVSRQDAAQGMGGTMIKSELVQRIASQNPHLYQRDVENIVNAILGEIVAAMARGDRVELRGFGAFSVKNRPARMARNPRTGARVWVEKNGVPFSKRGREWRGRLTRPAETPPQQG